MRKKGVLFLSWTLFYIFFECSSDVFKKKKKKKIVWFFLDLDSLFLLFRLISFSSPSLLLVFLTSSENVITLPQKCGDFKDRGGRRRASSGEDLV